MNNHSVIGDEPTFLGDLSVLNLKTEYRSLKEDPVREFYRPCLLNSNGYKRAVGYFRSTVYDVIGTSIMEFARRGGRTELICSPELSEEDIDSIALGYARKIEVVGNRLSQEIEALLASEETSVNTRILATLVSVGALEIKVALRTDRKGVYHEKIGIFSDGVDNAVSFKGSANETWGGWHRQGNFESIEVFCSWRGGLEAQRVKKHTAHFDALWAEHDPDVEVFSFPTDAVAHLKKAAFRDLDAVGPSDARAPGKRRTPLLHQDAAVDAWLSRGGRGILEHATGSGKTFTALMAIRRHIEGGNPALVVVPSRLLLDQWASEIGIEVSKSDRPACRWGQRHLESSPSSERNDRARPQDTAAASYLPSCGPRRRTLSWMRSSMATISCLLPMKCIRSGARTTRAS